MDDTSFRRLVARYEHDSRDDPIRFARLTAAMAAFGYAAILATLAASAWGLVWGTRQLLHGRVAGWKVLLVPGQTYRTADRLTRSRDEPKVGAECLHLGPDGVRVPTNLYPGAVDHVGGRYHRFGTSHQYGPPRGSTVIDEEKMSRKRQRSP